jgi:hypothetical protein
MGPAATYPSNRLAQQGFCHSWMAGMLLPLRAGLESTRSLPKGRPAQRGNCVYAKQHKQQCDRGSSLSGLLKLTEDGGHATDIYSSAWSRAGRRPL